MSKQEVVKAFRRHAVEELKRLEFAGPRGHFVRRVGAVTQVIELQHSIYGGRVTANLGLDLEWLKPLVRWIPRPAVGPHAHDAVRWVRIGLVTTQKADVWWSFDERTESLDRACGGAAEAVLSHGIRWLEKNSGEKAFSRYAEDRLRRSRTRARPNGSFLELRLLAAVRAWSGDLESARELTDLASDLWQEERGRLVAARRAYQQRHPRADALPSVPNLLRELETIISSTRGSRAFAPSRASSARRRSR